MNCACGHPLSQHCKPGTFHSYWRSTGAKPKGDYCTTSHCEAPLCDCRQARPKEEREA